MVLLCSILVLYINISYSYAYASLVYNIIPLDNIRQKKYIIDIHS